MKHIFICVRMYARAKVRARAPFLVFGLFLKYRHVGCLNRGFWTHWIDSRGLFYLKINLTLKHIFICTCKCMHEQKCSHMRHFLVFGLFLKYRHLGCLNRGFWTRWIDSRGLFYLKITFEAHFHMYSHMHARAKVRSRASFVVCSFRVSKSCFFESIPVVHFNSEPLF